jgi:hypothetical protein
MRCRRRRGRSRARKEAAVRFVDGPAAGVHLSLCSCPILLRVVRRQRLPDAAQWNGLDQRDDKPEMDDQIFLYCRKEEGQWFYVDGRDAKTGKRFGRTDWLVDYFHVADAPPDEVLRDTSKYHAWCEANKDRFLPKEVK